nr:hypothetical protein [uncultured Campylobacter sp.]
MLQTILTELKGGDNAKISQALSAGVKKICEDFEKVCLAEDEFDGAFKDEPSKDETREQIELDFEKMSDEEIDAELERQEAELDRQFDKINKGFELFNKAFEAIGSCDSLLLGIQDIVCDEFANKSINTQLGNLLKEQASKLSHEKAKKELLDTANKIIAFADDRANGASVLFGNALYIFKADKLVSKVKTNVTGLLDDEGTDEFENAKKVALELLKEHELGSKLLLWAELKRAKSALEAEFADIKIENLEF